MLPLPTVSGPPKSRRSSDRFQRRALAGSSASGNSSSASCWRVGGRARAPGRRTAPRPSCRAATRRRPRRGSRSEDRAVVPRGSRRPSCAPLGDAARGRLVAVTRARHTPLLGSPCVAPSNDGRIRDERKGRTMSAATIDELREQVRGPVIAPDDDGYDEARAVYNAMIDRRPAVVVRAADAGDVMAGVSTSRARTGLDLAVRGGGHSVPGFGTCDGGVVIDLSGMRGVRVDPGREDRAGRGRRDLGRLQRGHVRRSAWRRPAASSRPPASAGSRSAAGSATSRAGSGCRCDNLRLGRRRDRRRPVPGRRANARTTTCSGRCAAAAGTSAS